MMPIGEDRLRTHARSNPAALAISDGTIAWTHAQLDATVDAAVSIAMAGGLGEGSRIGALLQDGAASVALFHASRRLGAILVPLSRRAALPELRDQIADARIDSLVHDDADAERAAEVGDERMLVEVSALLETDSGTNTNGTVPDHTVDPSQPALILFTSGTSGRPKGAVLSHANLAASADAWAARLEARATDSWLVCLPMYHVAGLAIVVRAYRLGVPLHVQAGFDVASVDAAIEAGVSHLSLVPQMLDRLLEYRDGRPAPASLRAILLGGGPIEPLSLERARSAGLDIVTTYGMTETASGIAAGTNGIDMHAGLPRLRPLEGVDISIRGASRDDRKTGEIVVRGPMVSRGYVTAGELPHVEPYDHAPGVFDTGDVGALEAGGSLVFGDRADDLFISGGENVYPAEVEAVLATHAAVAEAAVVSRSDARWGQVPVAAVVAAAGQSIDADAIRHHCRLRLAAFKVPTEIHVLTSLPRSPDGKLMRRKVRHQLGSSA